MNSVAAQRQQLAFFALLCAVSYAAARSLAHASTEHTVIYIFGTIACVLAFLNAEIAVYFLIIAMLLSPEVEVGQTAGASLGRPVTLRLDDFLLLIICSSWFLKSVFYKEIDLFKHTKLNSAIYLYSFAALFSTMLGMVNGNVDPKTGALFVLKYVEYFLIFLMVVNTVHDEGQIKRFLVVACLVALIVCVVAIGEIPRGGRISAPFEGQSGEPNTLGGYLLFMMSLVGAFVFVDNKYRWPAVGLLLVMLMAFVYTLSRASYLGLIPVAFLLPILTRRHVLFIGTVIVALLLLLFPQKLLPNAVYSRINYTFTQTSTHAAQLKVLGTRVDTSTSARLLYMEAAVDAFYQKPVFGWGVTGWHFIDSQYFRALSETGLFGLSTLLFLLFRVLQTAFKSMKEMKDRNPVFYALSVGFITGTVGLMVHAIGSNTFIIVRIMEPFWLICALVYVLPEITSPIPEEPQAV